MGQLATNINDILTIDPSAPALEFERSWMSWGEIRSATDAIEEALGDPPPNTRVGVMLRNRPESVVAVLACVARGATLVTLNPVYPDDKFAEDVGTIAAPIIVGSGDDWARPGVRDAADQNGSRCVQVTRTLEVSVLSVGLSSLLDESRSVAPGVAVEMLTSGTTGKPKRVPLRSDAFERAVLAALNFEAGRRDSDGPRLREGVQVLHGPVSHIGGLMAFINAVMSGRRMCLLERFNVTGFHDAVKRHRPKVVGAPPAGLRMILDAGIPKEDLASLAAIRTGTAPLDPTLADAFYEKYGVPVLQNYGATEFGGVAGWTMSDYQAHRVDKRGAVGRLNPGIEARAVDGVTSQPLPAGQEGVLELRGPQIGNGKDWLRTTDLAVVDEERFLFIRGRADNAIIRGGFKVQPDDIVNALNRHPGIRESAVVGLPDPRLGQAPAAAYVLRKGAAAPSEDELIQFLRKQLAPYQIPTRFLLLDELPRTASMKVSQPELKTLFDEATR